MTKAILAIEKIAKRFGALRAVDDLSFSVNENEIVGLIGPNGAGKTTAINLVSGLFKPDNGRIVFEENDVTGVQTHQLTRRGLVRTFQATNVYQTRTVRENVYCGALVSLQVGFLSVLLETTRYRSVRNDVEARVEQILDRLNLMDVADSIASNLPYGFQKILGLAIALASAPKLILLDEPAAGLAVEEAKRIAQVIKAINRTGVSVVVVDHNVRFISSICDRVVVMHLGAELATDTPDRIIRDPRVIEAYLGGGHGVA